MSTFKCTIGKDEVECTFIMKNMLKVIYKGQQAVINYDGSWHKMSGEMDEKTVQKIGKAIKSALKS